MCVMYHTCKDYMVQELLKFKLIYCSSLLIQTKVLHCSSLLNCIKPLEYCYETIWFFGEELKIEKKSVIGCVNFTGKFTLIHKLANILAFSFHLQRNIRHKLLLYP